MSVFSPVALHQPASIAQAVALLAAGGPDCAPLAGGTWVMRAPIRHEAPRRAYVSLAKVADLRGIAITGDRVEIGATATHAMIAEALADCPDLQVLAEAAGRAANPAVRMTATLGGNLCTVGFPAADLVPALLSLDGEVELARPQGQERLSLERFLMGRPTLAPGWLLTKIVVRRSATRSAHVRLPLRKAGDYPVAIVSLAATLGRDGRMTKTGVAIGSVEDLPRRWTQLESALLGQPLDPDSAGMAAERLIGEITGRDGVEAPGWYRTRVLPTLVRRAIAAVAVPLSPVIASPCRSA